MPTEACAVLGPPSLAVQLSFLCFSLTFCLLWQCKTVPSTGSGVPHKTQNTYHTVKPKLASQREYKFTGPVP